MVCGVCIGHSDSARTTVILKCRTQIQVRLTCRPVQNAVEHMGRQVVQHQLLVCTLQTLVTCQARGGFLLTRVQMQTFALAHMTSSIAVDATVDHIEGTLTQLVRMWAAAVDAMNRSGGGGVR